METDVLTAIILPAIAGALVALLTGILWRRRPAAPVWPALTDVPAAESEWTVRYTPDAAERLWRAVIADMMAERLESALCGGSLPGYRDNRHGWLN